MSTNYSDKYEMVVGLEVHAQLLTKSKAYSSDKNEYGELPNRNISEVTLGLPGSLPLVNKKVPELAVRLGLAMNCTIRKYNMYARKNYFYADLPKGYQISQFDTPICHDGYLMIKDADGNEKRIGIERIHMEEDAGKSIHDQDPFDTLIDLNRAGVPLVEIVSHPDMRSPQEANAYLTEIRKLVRFLDVCDGNMEEGSLRCDANVSIRLKGSTTLGTKVEVKNMNSIRNVQRALEFEFQRQCEMAEKGEIISQETRTFDAVSGKTFAMRSKEKAHDYRYFPEPDLPPLIITDEYVAEIKAHLPELPQQLWVKYTKELGIPEYDAYWITEDKYTIAYFEEARKYTNNYKAISNWLMGPIRSYLNENGLEIKEFGLSPARLVEIIALVEANKVSNTVAVSNIFPEMIADLNATALGIAETKNLIQESNADALNEWVEKALAAYPDKVVEYKGGKKGVIGLFMGEVMKFSGGKADPKLASAMLREKLEA
ncbi:MAG TPA: Asp-tRNA(Asn)/Glu-tRNA(Gln) amidotransferase subunit GatB [Bacteroidia bacterium]